MFSRIFPIAVIIAGVFVLTMSVEVRRPDPAIRIGFAHGSSDEQSGGDQLRRILDVFEVDQWIFTDTVVINRNAIPHSHPVLTLNTSYLHDDHAQLANFLHEQFHWLVSKKQKEMGKAMKRFRAEFPSVPASLPSGARDEFSTYLHLIICDMEFQAMESLVGQEQGRNVLARWRHYTWIYEQVLTNPAIRKINLEAGFNVIDEGDLRYHSSW